MSEFLSHVFMLTGILFWIAVALFLIAILIEIIKMFCQSFDFAKRVHKYRPGKKNFVQFLEMWIRLSFNNTHTITWCENNISIHREGD